MQAACRGMDTEHFYPVSLVSTDGQAQAAEAKAICWACPVRRPCLRNALDIERREPESRVHGIRGGYLPSERIVLMRRWAR
ncbi:WhiB family transcriptional regulator [Jiangella asiatica]|uniref:WhiB family transcriptional regulator n=2 Tax=Jiangella asiatica TaxID=2530372 RepID=A0A4R5CZR5_9ACTN|nr:WhiB family transcriptional regulator [Jiangella asiatica]